jgi:hypothetical protein
VAPQSSEDRAIRDRLVASLREQYAEMGCPRGPMCASHDCLTLASRRVFWPVLPGEEFPVYCDHHAAWAKHVLETLGHKYGEELLPVAQELGKTRRIELP